MHKRMAGAIVIAIVLATVISTVFVIGYITQISEDREIQEKAKSLSYQKQVKFVSASEKIIGHIVTARENMIAGNQELAALHFTHPVVELNDNLHTATITNYSQIDHQIDLFLFYLKTYDTDVTIDEFDEQSTNIIKTINRIKNILVLENTLYDSVFKLDVIIDLLETSDMEYRLGVDFEDQPMSIIEFQDSYAFVVRAESILNTIHDIDTTKKNKLILQLDSMKSHILDRHTVDDISIEIKNIVDEIIVIQAYHINN